MDQRGSLFLDLSGTRPFREGGRLQDVRRKRGFQPGGAETGLERLEIRCVPASNKAHALLTPAARAIKVGGELVISGSGTFVVTAQLNAAKSGRGGGPAVRAGTDAANTLPLASGIVRIASPGHKTVQIQVRNISSLRINGDDGDDAITLKGRVPNRFSITIDPKGGINTVSSKFQATIIRPTGAKSSARPVPLSTIEQQIVDLVNAQRAAYGLGSLTVQSQLTDAAKSSTGLMVSTNRMSHVFPESPGLANLSDRLKAAGYQYSWAGENVASLYESAADVVDGWMNSPGHRANILAAEAKEVGVSVAESSSGVLYFCLVVGASFG